MHGSHRHAHHHDHHHYDDDHRHAHGDDHGHGDSPAPTPAPGHNHPSSQELHSHLRGSSGREDIQALSEQFIDGFRSAEDKQSFLRLAGVPDRVAGDDGLARRLVDVTITDGYQVATASPAFGSRDLVYLPFPGSMIAPRTKLTFVYVSLTGRSDVDLVDFLAARFPSA